MSKRLAGDAGRFLVAGGINTTLTSLIYFIGLGLMPSSLSYALAWVAGLAFAIAFYPHQVFPGGRTSTLDRLLVGGSIIAVFLLGLVLLHFSRELLANEVAAFLVTLASTTVLNFLSSRWILRRPC